MSQDMQETVADRVAQRLTDEIRGGLLAAGQPLRQNDVAERLGVSSTPVREAFHILERGGLVEREGRRGVRVIRPSVDDVTEVYVVREVLESRAASLAAERLSDEALTSLHEIMGRMHGPALTQEDFLRLDMDFHVQIARASGNSRLANLVESEKAAATTFVTFLGVSWSDADAAHDEHAAVVAALERHDSKAAAAAMTAHLRRRATALRTRLDPSGSSEFTG